MEDWEEIWVDYCRIVEHELCGKGGFSKEQLYQQFKSRFLQELSEAGLKIIPIQEK